MPKRMNINYNVKCCKWPEDDFTRDMPGIAFDSEDVIEHLKVFLKSLEKVDDDYYVFDLDEKKLKELSPRAKTKALKHTERVFAYEFYHQWSVCKTDVWVLNAELFKHLDWFYPKKKDGKDDLYSYKSYPDMVLHRGQQADDQMIVCEIKRDYRVEKDIVDDLIKLYKFTRKNDQQNLFKAYHCGIFLVINAEMDVIVNNILRHSLKLAELINSNSVDNLICVASSVSGGKKIMFQSFGEIVRSLRAQGLLQKFPIAQLKGQPKKRTQAKTK